jgi:3-phenylpropionate/cinnamic acid dioxygenase small subunit
MAMADDARERATAFLFDEAEYLDDNRLDRWLELLHPDLDYEIPVRVTRERSAGAGFVTGAYHMKETYASLQQRVARLSGDFAWAEDPPSRTRRIVGNVRAIPDGPSGELAVKSNTLLFRSRYDLVDYQLLAYERVDRVVVTDGILRLLRRRVHLDHTTLPIHNLAVFL